MEPLTAKCEIVGQGFQGLDEAIGRNREPCSRREVKSAQHDTLSGATELSPTSDVSAV